MGYESSRVNKNSLIIKSLIQAAKELRINTELWPLSPAAAPLSVIQKELGLNFITGGLGIGGFAHSPNEFFQVSSILNNRIGYYLFLQNYNQYQI